MLLSDYSYDLPASAIAKYPPKVRGTSRLIVLDRQTGAWQDSAYRNLDAFLDPGDLLVINDTKVMRSRLFTTLPDGRKRELVVLEKHSANGDPYTAHVMHRGRLHAGDVLTVASYTITVKQVLDGGLAVVSSATPIDAIVSACGAVPLPPYLHRDADQTDTKRYQTVWAKNLGSSAAPTASLNMTAGLLKKLHKKGVQVQYLTLHVGLGTFLPIREDRVEDHKMHSEWFNLPADTVTAIQNTKRAGHRVVALGTTVTRTLEFWGKTGRTAGEDDIFIYPGFNFTVVDALLTNFHAPKSTVLMLAAAFAGWDKLKPAYAHCVSAGYRFLSYGDSMLII